jgi:hypothetical protein
LPFSHLGEARPVGSTLSASCSKAQEVASGAPKRALGGHRASGDDPERAEIGDSGPSENKAIRIPQAAPATSCGHDGGPVVSEAHPSPLSPRDGRCRRLINGVCEVAAPGPCPFNGRGMGACSWHEVEAAPVAADGEVEAPKPDPAEILPQGHGGRTCGCGAPLAKSKQKCDECRTAARRQTKRENQRARRLRRDRRDGELSVPSPQGRPTPAYPPLQGTQTSKVGQGHL